MLQFKELWMREMRDHCPVRTSGFGAFYVSRTFRGLRGLPDLIQIELGCAIGSSNCDQVQSVRKKKKLGAAGISSILHADTVKDWTFGLPSEIVTHLKLQSYKFMGSTVCTLAPKITTVQVDYTNAGINTTQLDNGVTNVGGLAGLSAVTTISNMQFFAQTIFANVGDEL
ncbi:hypothetical protein B0H13DRAFT_1875934 [Mycena leptocephala]|nr:hypothetical protein B0H13DRAFT_1875934 [Mycena leptocephala]